MEKGGEGRAHRRPVSRCSHAQLKCAARGGVQRAGQAGKWPERQQSPPPSLLRPGRLWLPELQVAMPHPLHARSQGSHQPVLAAPAVRGRPSPLLPLAKLLRWLARSRHRTMGRIPQRSIKSQLCDQAADLLRNWQ